MTRPKTLDDLAFWAAIEGAAARMEPPEVIHRRFGDDPACPCGACRDSGELDAPAAIHGLPFARAFVSYIDGGHKARTPIRRALSRMHSRSRRQSVEYRIAFAVVEGGQSPAHIATVLRCADAVMYRSLALLWDLTEREKANDRNALSSPAVSVA